MKIMATIKRCAPADAQEAGIEVWMETVESGTPSPRTRGLPYGHASDLQVGISCAVRVSAFEGPVLWCMTVRSPTYEKAGALLVEELRRWTAALSTAVPELAERMQQMLAKGAP